jgi:hypothetical protein
MAQTDFSNKVSILADLYANYRNDPNLRDFIDYNDLGLPLTFLAVEGLAEITSEGAEYIEETWLLFMASLGIEDTGFEDLDSVLTAAENK